MKSLWMHRQIASANEIRQIIADFGQFNPMRDYLRPDQEFGPPYLFLFLSLSLPLSFVEYLSYE